MIRAIIFDLDNCLSPATAIGVHMLDSVVDAIRKSNQHFFSATHLQAIEEDLWRLSLDVIFAKYGFPDVMQRVTWQAYSKLAVNLPMQGYPDIGLLPELPAMRFLVTTGFRRLQESKIRALGIGRLFTEVHVDAIDEDRLPGKQAIFADILVRRGLLPDQVLVVGDNPYSEIAAGNNLGLSTVQILRPGVERGTNAQHFIDGLSGLKTLLLTAPSP